MGLHVGSREVKKIKYLNLKVEGKPVSKKILLVSSFHLI